MTKNPDLGPAGQSQLGEQLHLELNNAKLHLEGIAPAVTIFGGARVKATDPYYAATVELAQALSRQGIAVLSGGGPGIMEAANKGARAGQHGLSIGLNITLEHEQKPNPFQDIGLTFEHFSSRKAAFCKYSRAFVVMPGGVGTMDELFEIVTLIQTKKSAAAPVLLYGREFWQGLVSWMQGAMVAGGMLSDVEMALFTLVDSVDEAMGHLTEQSVAA
jgi:uncharacterized protein (TIGR00730 family)